jgi:hypothetical protein
LAGRLINDALKILGPQERAILIIRTADRVDYETVMRNCPAEGREQYFRTILDYAEGEFRDLGAAGVVAEIWDLLANIDPSETVSWDEKVLLVRFWVVQTWRTACDELDQIIGPLVNIQSSRSQFLRWCESQGFDGEIVSEDDFTEIMSECIQLYSSSIME